MPVQRVVRSVDLAAHEPLGERRVGPVKGLGEVLIPRQQLTGLLGPERGTVRLRLCIGVSTRHRIGGKLRRRCEFAVLVEEVFKRLDVWGLTVLSR
ncbi:hypothetical protein D3C73_1204300 [compost metagenome]